MMINQPVEIKPSLEMENLFMLRTQYHQNLVQHNLLKMVGYEGLSWNELELRGRIHDQSKFQAPERIAYIWMTWMYHCQHHQITFQYPPGISDLVTHGWQHHIRHNLHHPEAHAHHDAMETVDLIEMVADWMAISQENQQSIYGCLAWAQNNIDKKWQFSRAKKQFIFATIDELAKRLTEQQE